MTIASELIARFQPGMTELIVSPEEFSRLMYDEATRHIYCDDDPMPKPPVKSRSESRSRSIFSWKESSYVEYDRQDPDYQRQLEAWRMRQQAEKSAKKDLVLYGPFGPVRIKMQEK